MLFSHVGLVRCMEASEAATNRPGRRNALRVLWARLNEHPLSRLGPGLITGVADDDPSGIATYSQAGAQFEPCAGSTLPAISASVAPEEGARSASGQTENSAGR